MPVTYKTIDDLPLAPDVLGNDSLEISRAGTSNRITVEQFFNLPDGVDLTVNGSTTLNGFVDIVRDTGYGVLQVGGPDGAYIDLAGPVSDDYDLRIITNGAGGNLLSPGSISLEPTTQYLLWVNGLLKMQSTTTQLQLFQPVVGTTSTFMGGVYVGDNVVVATTFNGATDTGVVRAGVTFNGAGQALGFQTVNTLRGYFDNTGQLNLLGALAGTTAAFSGNVSTAGALTFGTLPAGAGMGGDGGNVGIRGYASGGIYFESSGGGALYGGITSTGLIVNGDIRAKANTAIGAGATTQSLIKASNTAEFGIYYGTGAPGFTASANSLYIRKDATTTTTRLYINTTGAAIWATFTASA